MGARGAEGREKGQNLGGDRAAAGDDVPQVHVGLLPQLLPCQLSLARGACLHLLHHLAGGAVLQGVKGDLALAAALPDAAREVELWIPVVLLRPRPLCSGLILLFLFRNCCSAYINLRCLLFFLFLALSFLVIDRWMVFRCCHL